MARHPGLLAPLFLPFVLAACSGGGKTPPKKPVATKKKPVDPPKQTETEEDRDKKRLAAAHGIVPDGSSCLPTALKENTAPRLELAAIGADAVVCAIDTDETRLLGPVACWKVDLAGGGLTYIPASPLPGRGISVLIDDRCARGYCLPKDAKAPAGKVARMAWNAEGAKVAILFGDDVHVYDASSKAHESSFSIRGDKGVTNDPGAVHWVGDMVFVEGMDSGPYAGVWAFKAADGAPVGGIEAIGAKDGKPISTFGGSFSLLDKGRVAIAEQGFSTVTVYETANGARSKLVRKLTKPPCKNDEVDAYWKDENDKVGAKCKDALQKNFAHLQGATAVAGSKNFLVMLRGPRLGELAVLDSKTLAEKKAIKLAWCTGNEAAAGGGGGAPKDKADALASDDDEAKPAPKGNTRAPAKKSKGAEDPDAGGE
ncbi:MAG: hypothetical protein H0T46_29715 [Deltaproteobacteria bacterium]|nr:hypothetical protein [Deltaproteobacteria bacterium]